MMVRILIIDDSPIIRNLLLDFLIEEGYEVEATGDPIEGTRMALEQDWSVCICDSHMPGKQGHEVFEEVRAAKPDLTFLTTDSLPDENQISSSQPGANHYYLKKPFDLGQVREILIRCLTPTKTR